MSPSDARVSAAGARTTSCTTWATVSVAEPETPSASALIAAVPLSTDVASPDASTVATEESLDDHMKLRTCSTARPLASRASASRRNVSLSEAIVSAAGAKTTSCTAWAIVSNAEPETPSASALIAAVPLSTDVASPDPSTVAIEESLDDHVNPMSTGCPFASRASAARRSVSASETTVSAAGATTTSFTACATVTDAFPDTPPASALIVVLPLRTAVTSPDASTFATETSALDHVKDVSVISCPLSSRASARSCSVAPTATSVDVFGATVTVASTGGPVSHAKTQTKPANPAKAAARPVSVADLFVSRPTREAPADRGRDRGCCCIRRRMRLSQS